MLDPPPRPTQRVNRQPTHDLAVWNFRRPMVVAAVISPRRRVESLPTADLKILLDLLGD